MKRKPRTVAPGPPLDDDDAELDMLALLSREDIADAQTVARQRLSPRGRALIAAALLGAGGRYQWNPEAGVSGQYIDTTTGRPVPAAVIRRELDEYIQAADADAKAAAEALRARSTSIADWQIAMRREIKRTGLVSAALLLGGWAALRPGDFGRVAEFVREQYAFLQNFAAQIASGVQRLDGRLAQRAALYVEAGRKLYHVVKHEKAAGTEITHVRSIRHATDSCAECIEFDGRIFAIDDPGYPIPGDRLCGNYCKCTEEMLIETDSGYEVVDG